MGFTTRGWAAAGTCLFLWAAGWGAAGAGAQGLPAGTVGIGAGGSFGSMFGDSQFGNNFGSGGGYNLLLRYAASEHFSLGLNFQNQSYDYDGPVFEDETSPVTSLVSTSFEAALLYFHNRNSDASHYFLITAGGYRPEIRREDEDVNFPGENLMFSGGMGVELYLRENWAVDLQGRAIGYLGDGVALQEEDDVAPTGNTISFGLHAQAAIIYFILN